MACDPTDPGYEECVKAEQAAAAGTSGGGGSPTPDTGGDTTFGGIGDTVKSRTLSIPGNLEQPISDLAQRYGMDARLLAAVIYQTTRWRKADITEANLTRIAERVAAEFARVSQPSAQAQARAGGRRIPGPLDARTAWLTAAGNVAGVNAQVIDNLVAKDPTTSGDLNLGTGAARTPVIPGLSDSQAYAVQSAADSLFVQYLGRLPTNDEYLAMAGNKWTQQQVQDWLRAQPYGSTTLGQWDDTRAQANKYAQQFFTKNADDGQINYLIQQGITDPDRISAYFEQLRQRVDTGDPAFAWASDPTSWRSMESTVQGLLRSAGLTGKADPKFVNDAVSRGLSTQQIQEEIDRMPAPGFKEGVTVGELNRVRGYAKQWKEEFAPGEQLTTAELGKFISMSSDEVEGYYRAMPLQSHIDALKRAKDQQGAQVAGGQAVTPTSQPPAATPKPATPAAPKELSPSDVKSKLGITLSGPGANAKTEVAA